jgi:uncharacterized protein YjbJ (UPF0337 family)
MAQRPDEVGRHRRSGIRVTRTRDTDESGERFRSFDEESPEAIRREIERTRSEMSETIDAIQEKLDPESLRHQATEAVRGATIGRAEGAMNTMIDRIEEATGTAGDTARETGSGLMETIKQNPVPALLAGIGIGWLLMNRSASRPTYSDYRRRMSAQHQTRGYEGRREPYRYDDQGGGPGQMARQAGEVAGEAGSGITNTIRENPLPSALLGLGLGWLLVNRSTSGGGQGSYGYGAGRGSYYGAYEGYYERSGIDDARERAGQAAGRAQESVSETAGRAQHAVGHAAEQVQETVGHAAEQVQQRVSHATDQAQGTVEHFADDFQETAGRFAHETQYRARRLEDQVQDMLRTNPLGVGAAALAVGAVIGLIIPETRREHEMMGETRDNLMRQARVATEETVQKVQRVAEEVQHTVEEEAREQGLG